MIGAGGFPGIGDRQNTTLDPEASQFESCGLVAWRRGQNHLNLMAAGEHQVRGC